MLKYYIDHEEQSVDITINHQDIMAILNSEDLRKNSPEFYRAILNIEEVFFNEIYNSK